VNDDEAFFTSNPDRQCHIRTPGRELHKDRQRSVRYLSENEIQFRSLGPHDQDQRRILSYRVPADNELVEKGKVTVVAVPMLAFKGEVIEDTDEVLLPILAEIMEGQVDG